MGIERVQPSLTARQVLRRAYFTAATVRMTTGSDNGKSTSDTLLIEKRSEFLLDKF